MAELHLTRAQFNALWHGSLEEQLELNEAVLRLAQLMKLDDNEGINIVVEGQTGYPETHRTGMLTINDMAWTPNHGLDVDLGVQVARDGRVWLCVNGVAWIRFKPHRPAL